MIESKIKVICIDLDDAVMDLGSRIYETSFNGKVSNLKTNVFQNPKDGKSYLLATFSVENVEE